MYAYPVLLPQTSNREDLLLTVALFDDDLGTPVLMDGTSVPGNQAFTSSAWTVTDGTIVTTSATQITIPVYPIGSQLSVLPLTVGIGLAIAAGDPIKIADTATGLNTMIGYVLSYVSATGLLTVQIGDTFEFEVRRTGAKFDGSGYIPWFDFGVQDEYGPLISAQLGNGITIVDVGVMQIFIPASTMQKLRGGTYLVAMTVTDSVNTRQMFIGQLPILHGGVSKPPVNSAASSYNPNIF